jgi:hypothetical protein
MTKAPIRLQDLRRSLDVKAKAEPTWRFWGLYVHIGKRERLYEAYQMAKENGGAPGIDGVKFETLEESGVEGFLRQIRDELLTNTYRPMRARKKEIPKDGGKVRVLSIPTIRDRVVQGAVKLILEPSFEADFQPGAYGYRPNGRPEQREPSPAISCGSSQKYAQFSIHRPRRGRLAPVAVYKSGLPPGCDPFRVGPRWGLFSGGVAPG